MVTEDLKSELWRDLDRRVFVISQLVSTTQTRLKETEQALISNVQHVTPGSYAAVNELQRILKALEDRMNEVNGYVSSGNPTDIAKAAVISNADLVFKNDAMHKLLSEESLPPLPADQWAAKIDSLFQVVAIRKKRESSGLF